jgi:hypothetical protein
MSEQLPPVDPMLRGQLVRRSSGPIPGGLLRDTLARLDEPPSPRRFGFRLPRVAATFGSLALIVAVMFAAAVVLVPLIRTAPTTGRQLTGYPAERALTTAEMADLMSGPALEVNTTFVASVTIRVRNDVCPMNRAPTIGVIEGMNSQVCVMDLGSGLWPTERTQISGTFVFRYWAAGYIAVIAQVVPASESRLAYRATDRQPSRGMYLVDAWVHSGHVVGNDPAGCPGQTPDESGSVNCAAYWLSDSQSDASAWRLDVQLVDGMGAVPAGHGVVLLSADPCDAAADPADSCSLVRIVARIDDDPFASLADHSPTPAAPPSAATPAPTPTASPLALPSAPVGAQPLGIWGVYERPLTVDELPTLWAEDPQHLAGRVVIVKGPVPAGFLCWSAGQADAGISPAPCHIAVQPSQIAADGHYWAVQVGGDGNLTVLGEIQAESEGFVFTLDQLTGKAAPKAGSLAVVDGWLVLTPAICDGGASAHPSGCGSLVMLSSNSGLDQGPSKQLQKGAFRLVTGRDGDLLWNGPPVPGRFLIRLTQGGAWELLAQMETVVP